MKKTKQRKNILLTFYQPLVFILTWALCTSAFSQNIQLSENENSLEYSIKTWVQNQKIGNLAISDIAYLSDGQLLLSTKKGLMTFNGSHLKKYKFKNKTVGINNLIYNIKINHDGVIWGVSKTGLFRIKDGKYKEFGINSKSINYNLIALDSTGSPWLLIDKKLFYFINDKLKPINARQNYSAFNTGRNYIIAANQHTIQKLSYTGKELETYKLPSEIIDINLVFETSNKIIWIGSDQGLFYLDKGTVKKFNFPQESSKIISIFEDKNHILWLGSNHLYAIKNMQLKTVISNNPVLIRGITQDSDENIWFGSWGKGISRLKKTSLEPHINFIKFPWQILTTSNNSQWVTGFSEQVYLLKNKTRKKIQLPTTIKLEQINSISEGLNNEVWIGYKNNILHYNNDGKFLKEIPNPINSKINSSIYDENKTIWFLLGKSLYFLDLDKKHKLEQYKPLQNFDALQIQLMLKKLLVITKYSFFTVNDNKQLKPYKQVIGQNGSSLIVNYNQTLEQLWYYTPTDNSLVQIKNKVKSVFFLDDHITDLFFYNLHIDDHGNIYLLGENGIVRIKSKWVNDYKKPFKLKYEFLLSTQGDELKCNNSPSAITEDANNIYFICNNSILTYKRNESKESTHPIPYIDQIYIDKLMFNSGQLNSHELPPSTQVIEFDYSSNFLNKVLSLEYRYKLKGLESNWHYSQDSYSATYVSLHPGTYEFEVQVKTSNEDWQTSENAKFSFTIMPYFYERYWFIFFLCLLLIILVTHLVQLRIKRLRKTQKQLTTLVQERTETLQNLQKIALKKERESTSELSHQVSKRTHDLKKQMQLTLKIEKQLRQSQKMEIIGHLTSGIAHDFNNILSVIFLGTDIIKTDLKNEYSDNRISYEWSEKINVAGKKCREIISQLLHFAKTNDQQFQLVTVSDILNDSINLIQVALPESLILSINIKKKNELLKLDLIRFNQIILNLILNARDSCSKNGSIEISTENITTDKMICSACLESFSGEHVQINIKDDGVGISDNKLPEIFKPFYSSKNKSHGTGIGLQIINSNMHAMGGHVCVKNKQEKGVTFSLYFPIVTKLNDPQLITKQQSTKHIPNNEVRIHPIQVLLVEDSLSLSKSIKQVLELANIKVEIANDGKDGLECFLKNKNKYNIILTDNKMPRMDGITMATKILNIDNTIPILLFTGYNNKELFAECKSIGIKKVVQKPYNANELIDYVNEFVS